MKKIYYSIISFLTGIKNFFIYAPVIYKDRDFDYTFFYQLMRVKLEKMSKAGIDKRVDLCLSMIPFLLEEDLEMDSYYRSRFSFIRNAEGLFTLERDMEEDNLEEFFAKHRAKERIVRKKFGDRGDLSNYRIATHITTLIEQQAKRIFFRTIENNIDRWWN